MSDIECHRCGRGINAVQDDHYRLDLERRPVPDPEDMEVDDWFTPGVYLCRPCVKDELGVDLA